MKRYTQTDLSQETFDAIDGSLTALETALADFAGLSTGDRRRIRSVGQRTEAFVFRAMESGKQNAGLLPRDLDLEQIERDHAAREALIIRLNRLRQASEKVQDTLHLLGADLLRDTLGIYHSLKRFGASEGLDDVLDTLQQRFRQTRRQAEQAETPSAPSAG